MKKLKYLVALFIFLSCSSLLHAQVFIDDSDTTAVPANDDVTNIEEILNYDKVQYDTLVAPVKTSTDIYIKAKKLIDDDNAVASTKVSKSAFVNASWADFLKLVDSLHTNYFVQFGASWCGPCKMMEKDVFEKSDVIEEATRNFRAKLIDVDDFDGVQITQDLKIKSIPATIIFSSTGKELRRIEGYLNKDTFLDILKDYQ